MAVKVPTTGVELIDSELARHAFSSREDAEAMATSLLAAWRLMQPGQDTNMLRWRRRRRE
jgi:hypothetical protein